MEDRLMTEYECPTCNDTYGAVGAVREHAWKAHSACHHCGDEFDTQESLYTHWLAVHDEDLSEADWKRAEQAVGPLTFGDRLSQQGPGAAVGTLSRRQLLFGSGAVLTGGVAAWSTLLSGEDDRSQTGGGGAGGTEVGATATEARFTTVHGETKQLSEYRGQKVMFWVFATWCPSCQKAAQALQKNNDKLQNVQILALKTHGNAGYDGPTITKFAQQYAPQLVNADNWVWSTLSEQSTNVWNPQNRPDIYWLIDADGTIQAKTAAPAATINQITQFAQENTGDRPGKSIEIQPAKHIQPGESHPSYNSNPPTSGWHYRKQAEWGFYSNELPDERVIHNLEHGGIWIAYTNVSDRTRSKLQQLAQEYPKSVIVTRRSENNVPLAVASWGRLMKLQSFDRDRIAEFIEKNMNHSPEPMAGQ